MSIIKGHNFFSLLIVLKQSTNKAQEHFVDVYVTTFALIKTTRVHCTATFTHTHQSHLIWGMEEKTIEIKLKNVWSVLNDVMSDVMREMLWFKCANMTDSHGFFVRAPESQFVCVFLCFVVWSFIRVCVIRIVGIVWRFFSPKNAINSNLNRKKHASHIFCILRDLFSFFNV